MYIYARASMSLGAHPGYIYKCMHIYARASMRPGDHPGYIYVHGNICTYTYSHLRGRGPTLAIYIGRGRVDPGRVVYTQCHGASFTLAWAGVYFHAMAWGDPRENPSFFLVCIPFRQGKPYLWEIGWFRKFSARQIRRQEPGSGVHVGVQSSITHRCAYI